MPVDGLNRLTEFDPESARPDGAPDQAAAGERKVDFPFEEAGGREAGAGHNSEAIVEAIFKDTRRKLRSISGKSFDALKASAEVGPGLTELKKHLGRGRFGHEVEARLGITRQWCARLMKLGEEWPEITAAIEWAKAGNRLTRSEYSVDGALALLKEWRRELNGENAEPAKRKGGHDAL
jgi:hypothetical protein